MNITNFNIKAMVKFIFLLILLSSSPSQADIIDSVFGQSSNCPTGPLGNTDEQILPYQTASLLTRGARGNKNKFDNFVVTSDFNLINQYLMMQAANKTYYTNFKYGLNDEGSNWDYAKNEHEYRCGATELYKHWGFDEVYFANFVGGVNAIIAVDDEKVIFTIRGTQGGEIAKLDHFINGLSEFNKTLSDLITNISFQLSNSFLKGLGGGVFEEVDSAYASAAVNIVNMLHFSDQLNAITNNKNKPIFVTGHSLGAATAALVALRLNVLGYDTPAAYIAAPPEFGNKLFNQHLKNQLNLFVTWNYRDPVPSLASDFALTTVNSPLDYAFGAATQFTFYKKNDHEASIFNTTSNDYQSVLNAIRTEQEEPYPKILGVINPVGLSNEWHFHHSNFYLAFAYNQLINDVNFTPKTRTGIAPEFNELSEMCLSSLNAEKKYYHRNSDYSVYMSDAIGNPFENCRTTQSYQLANQEDLQQNIIENNLPNIQITVIKEGLGRVLQVYDETPLIDCGTNCVGTYTEGTRITLRQTAQENYKFVKWEGCDAISIPNHDCSISASQSKTVRAIFHPFQYTLTVLKSGQGLVKHVNPVGTFSTGIAMADNNSGINNNLFKIKTPLINCGSTCKALFKTPKTIFQISQDQAQLVNNDVRVNPNQREPQNSPTFRKNIPLNQELVNTKPKTIVLRATPNHLYTFKKWEGCFNLNSIKDCKITMNKNYLVKAIFEKIDIKKDHPTFKVNKSIKKAINKPIYPRY